MHEIYTRDPELTRLQADIGYLQAQVGLRKLQLALKYDPNQPRAPGGSSIGGRWIDNFAKLVGRGPVNPAKIVIGAGVATGLALYETLSRRNGPNSQAVAEFRASYYDAYESDNGRIVVNLASVRTLTRDEVPQYCKRFEEIQTKIDEFAAAVRKERPDLGPAQFGTEVHRRFEKYVNGFNDPDFVAEKSFVKGEEETRGAPGSIRLDGLNRVGDGTTCVYDPKTGFYGLSPKRIQEMAVNSVNHFKDTRRIIVTEVRLTP